MTIPSGYSVPVPHSSPGGGAGRVPSPDPPGELVRHRVAVRTLVRLLTNPSEFCFSFFDGDTMCSVCMWEVSNYGLSCHWIILFAGWRRAKERSRKEMRYSFCILTNDNLTDGEKETLKCMSAFDDRDLWPSCLLSCHFLFVQCPLLGRPHGSPASVLSIFLWKSVYKTVTRQLYIFLI